ncbi:hypothetical protein ZIOFF_063475 [Zingiber officinale]|uniref:Uncharacterized protein n=2 Tax=Zingiber officinale TaxID=94328 RepID=A0A8J5KK56_ZINOF|nr:hypothetical protein ZIOFF_063475 [Zingiber officinale]
MIMERQRSISEKHRRSLILKAFDRCRSLTRRRSAPMAAGASGVRPWRRSKSQAAAGTRSGQFTVHVGPNRERFVIRTECIGHPLFQTLLDQAEVAYGFASPGPLQLPCDVDLFHKVMGEMDQEMEAPPKCAAGFGRCYSAGPSYQLLSPSRLIVAGDLSSPANGHP